MDKITLGGEKRKKQMKQPTTYSNKFKAQAVEKALSAHSLGVKATARELNIPYTTLYGWKKKFSTQTMSKNKTFTPEEKLEAIAKTLTLSEPELGEYLRSKGLHSAQVEEWKEEFYTSQKTQKGRPRIDPEVKSLKEDKKALEKNLNRKDKALSEMSARVILLKKSHQLFGVSEEEE